jgi:glycine oxidase
MTSDVSIAGGGIIGATLAWRLAQQGASVSVMERGAWGAEASTAAAGMLAPGGEVERAGDFAAMCLAAGKSYPDFVAELSEAGSGTIDYRQCGAFEFAATEDEAAALAMRIERQTEMGIAVEIHAPEGPWRASAHYPADAVVDPANIMKCLRAACERAGVEIREGVPVESIRISQGGAEILTPGGTYFAEAVVVAAGAWSSAISVHGAGPLPESRPVRGHLIAYPLRPEDAGPILRHGHTYVLHRSSGEVVAGTTHEEAGFRCEIDTGAVAEIGRRAAVLLPSLAALEPSRVWNGFRPKTAGPAPIIERWQESALWLAYGHYRNGILLAQETAARLAPAILASLRRS